MIALLSQENFFRKLFDAMPVLAIVVDEEGKVHTINQFGKNVAWVSKDNSYLKFGGQVLNCLHQFDDPRGCGYSPACSSCVIRNTALKTIKGDSIQRIKARFQAESEGELLELTLLVSSVSLEYHQKTYAVVILEDVSFITELQGLIPICAQCKKIRNDQGYWNRLEEYLESHTEAEFTHDICPECAKILYNKDIQ